MIEHKRIQIDGRSAWLEFGDLDLGECGLCARERATWYVTWLYGEGDERVARVCLSCVMGLNDDAPYIPVMSGYLGSIRKALLRMAEVDSDVRELLVIETMEER